MSRSAILVLLCSLFLSQHSFAGKAQFAPVNVISFNSMFGPVSYAFGTFEDTRSENSTQSTLSCYYQSSGISCNARDSQGESFSCYTPSNEKSFERTLAVFNSINPTDYVSLSKSQTHGYCGISVKKDSRFL